jgi:RimJ/RimL family protein N-acetyltransferase
MRSVPAHTARLRFRELTIDDVDSLLTIFADPVAMEFYPSTKCIEETRQWIRRCMVNYQKFGHCFWAVLLRETGEFIGQCGILYQSVRTPPENEIGYLFQRRFWGHGYATEAAIACRDWAFTHFRYDHVVCYIDPRNIRSIRVAQRAGMTLEQSLAAHENKWERALEVYAMNNPGKASQTGLHAL